MASESSVSVDQLFVKLTRVEDLIGRFNLDARDHDVLISESKDAIKDTQFHIDNNRAVIPPFCMKKASDALKRLEALIDTRSKSKLQFKFKSTPKPSHNAEAKPESNGGAFKKPTKEQSDPKVFFGFQDLTNQVLSLNGNEVTSKDVSLVNLDGCSVTITGLANTVYIHNLKSTTVSVYLACRSITVANCIDCSFKLICQQLRIDSTQKTRFEIFTSARSMLEASTGLEFKALELDNLDTVSQQQLDDLFRESKFDRSKNNWRQVDDFDWLSANEPSKNYKLVE